MAKLNTYVKATTIFWNPNSGITQHWMFHSSLMSLAIYQSGRWEIFQYTRSHVLVNNHIPSIIISRQVNVLNRTKLAKWTMQIFRPEKWAEKFSITNKLAQNTDKISNHYFFRNKIIQAFSIQLPPKRMLVFLQSFFIRKLRPKMFKLYIDVVQDGKKLFLLWHSIFRTYGSSITYNR